MKKYVTLAPIYVVEFTNTKNMDAEEYNKKLKEIQSVFDEKKTLLFRECALSNNKLKIGDVFTDHIGSIKVEKIKIYAGRYNELPSCVYFGLILKKDGTPTKKLEKRDAFQCNETKTK